MIKVSNLVKNFGILNIFDNFNISVTEYGLYILSGRSGAGKTTLLNILYGLEEFDSGEIEFNGKKYTEKVSMKEVSKHVYYMTQDSLLVSYLTIYDNLKLVSDDTYRIKSVSKQFFNLDLLNSYPHELSGGELQRVNLVRGLIDDYKIFFLDEPTANLDYENKLVVYEALKTISEYALILCVAHEEVSLNYTDCIIDIEEEKGFLYNSKSTIGILPDNRRNRTKLLSSLKKSKFKKSFSVVTIIILITCFLSGLMTLNPQDKIYRMLDDKYFFNYLIRTCDVTTTDCNQNLDKAKEVFYSLEELVYPLDIQNNEGFIDEKYPDRIDHIFTLPRESLLFKFMDSIEYGEYFKSKEDVILGFEKAQYISQITGIDIDDLINTPLKISFPTIEFTFNISGIFMQNDENFKSYLNEMRSSFFSDEGLYFSSEFSDYYFNEVYQLEENNDPYIFQYLFFNDFGSAMNFQKNYPNHVRDYLFSFTSSYRVFFELSVYLLAVSVILGFISLALYSQSILIELSYKFVDLSVYSYLGFSEIKIKISVLIDLLRRTTKNIIIALIGLYPISLLINSLYYLNLTPFKLVYFDLNYILIVIMVTIFFSFLFTLYHMRRLKIVKWYEIVRKGRDLL